MVSYRVAKTGKSHTIVENLILADIAGIMLGEKAKKKQYRRCHVLKQLLLRIKSSEFYALQIDESTYVAGLAQLLAYVRYFYYGSVMEDILFCKPLEGRATGEEIFKVLDGFVTSHGLQWTNCVGICTDGAKAMTGRLNGLVTRVFFFALCEVLQDAVKIVNFIKARPLNSRLFSALCNEMGSDHVILLLHTDVRWLSRGNVLTRLFELRDELFFIDHPFELSNRLHDEEWLTILAYLGDDFSRLNELNIGSQGVATTIFNVQDKTEAMIRKFALWTNCINENNTEAFSSLHDFLLANELNLTNSVKRDIMKHLSELSSQLRKYFPETDNSNTWIRNPFSAHSTAHLPVSEQESLIEISTSGALRIDFAQKLLTDFWIALHAEYPALADRALKTLLPFSTTYLCESGFSALAHIKNKYLHRE
ncbi:putative zinc finger BED domain-containing protein 5-like [Triplophysa rosa]|uniref:Zinc finger BED domain-containing protein 5-like n=1 Tax=Triplophysa rosa TaxID=992332 RepID=A0A9W7TX82_TRIRA|nr:putative zinc finger BED domain-containing protein 5-like [Triplophysa rosa]